MPARKGPTSVAKIMEPDDVPPAPAPAPGQPVKSDQQIFDDQVARAMGRAVLIFGGLGILAAIAMSTIALVNSSGDNGTKTVTVQAKQTTAAAAPAALTGDALGKQLFASGKPGTGAIACGSCHTLSAAGTVSSVGPDLDKELGPDPASATRESVVDPNKEIIPGFPKDVMPQNYATALTSAELDAVVNFVYHTTNDKVKAKKAA